MEHWENLPAPGKCWYFTQIVESVADVDEPAHAARMACLALWPVVQPLSITLEMAARSIDFPYIESDVPLPVSTFHLREAEVPPHVAVGARVRASGHREETTSQITPRELTRWLEDAHAQSLEEGYVPVLSRMEMRYTRARIIDAPKTYAELVFGPETYTIPIEGRQDGLWVSGPIRDTMTNPPIGLTLDNNDGALQLSICAGWSPWIESERPEAALLTRCLHDVHTLRWEEYDPMASWRDE